MMFAKRAVIVERLCYTFESFYQCQEHHGAIGHIFTLARSQVHDGQVFLYKGC